MRRTINLIADDLEIHENVDGYCYGAVFNILLTTEPRFQNTCLDMWGFGDTSDEAISNLLAWTEEWNAIYKHQLIRFQRPKVDVDVHQS